MLLRFRNTYKTRKIMLLYAILSITSFMLGTFGIMFITIFNYWWIYALSISFFIIFFYAFFLLVLENNGYKIKYYYDRKTFKKLYTELIKKYKIESKKSKRIIKKITLDYFRQYGKINEFDVDVKNEVFDDWLNKHTNGIIFSFKKEDILDWYFYELLKTVYVKEDYRSNIENLINIFDKNEIDKLLENCSFISKEFKEKCMFIFDYPSFVSKKILNDMYFELVLIIWCFLDILSNDDLNNTLYNPNFYYSQDKKMAYAIVKENNLYNVIEINLESESEEQITFDCDTQELAMQVINNKLIDYEIECQNMLK